MPPSWTHAAALVQNAGQGLGFKLGHTVIDRKTLTHTAFKLVSGFTTVYAVLLALSKSEDESPTSASVVCELSRLQTDTIRAVMAAERNASCSYNITLSAILAN